jgi:phosphate transport system protein
MPEHTIKAFDAELQEITRKIIEMGTLVEKQIASAGTALVRPDVDDARRIVGADAEVDRLQHDIEQKVVLTIARRQPMAVDLREAIGALRIVNDLERMGDYAKSIAKRVIASGVEIGPGDALRLLPHVVEHVQAALHQVLDAYARRDVEQALAVWRADHAIDAETNTLIGALTTQMTADRRNIPACTHLLFCAKNIERFGDRATNIAETVYYIAEGKLLDAERPKGEPLR